VQTQGLSSDSAVVFRVSAQNTAVRETRAVVSFYTVAIIIAKSID